VESTYSEDRVGSKLLRPGDETLLPIHWSEDSTSSASPIRAYCHVYGGAPVRNPFEAGLGFVAKQAIEGTHPNTRFVFTFAGNDERLAQVAGEWAVGAWRHSRASCEP
jgi:hypothetical protein